MIGKTRKDVCPVRAVREYLEIRARAAGGPLPLDASLFVFPDGTPLRRTVFVRLVRALADAAGLTKAHFAGHSFRIGGATDLARNGVPDHLIKTIGRWKSDCYQRYIRTPQATLVGLSLAGY